MRVIRASTAGFCMGVSLALKKLEKAISANSSGLRICTLGPIIHNPQVLENFARQGVCQLRNSQEAQTGDHVLIRAHGITRQEESLLRQKCAMVEDATCPRVKRAQLAIASATRNGGRLLLFGEEDHPEVRGLVSYAYNGYAVFGNEQSLDLLALDPALEWVLASQTTQDRELFETMASRLAAALPRLTILSTICDATRERQTEALAIASQVQVMVVAGGRESGNTRRLAAIASEAGIPAYHVEKAAELDKAAFSHCTIAGLTAGASTPLAIIDEIAAWLADL